MKLLYGNYDLLIDDKNRVAVPSEIRRAIDSEADGEAFFMVIGAGGKLCLYPEKYYESLASQRPSQMAPEDDLLAFDRLFFASASKVEWDKQGRIVIPEKIQKRANLSKEITLIGMRDHAEIWSRSDWETETRQLEERRAEIALRARHRQVGTNG